MKKRITLLGIIVFLATTYSNAQTQVTLDADPKTGGGVTFDLSGDAVVKYGAYSMLTAIGVPIIATVNINTKINISRVYISYATNTQGMSLIFYSGATNKGSVAYNSVGWKTVNLNNIDKIVINNDGTSNSGAGDFQTVEFVTSSVNSNPIIVGTISNISTLENASSSVINLESYFNDAEDGASGLTYSVQTTDPSYFSTSIASNQLTVDYALTGVGGPTTIKVRGTDTQSAYIEQSFTATVYASSVSYSVSGTESFVEGNSGTNTKTYTISKTGSTNLNSSVDFSITGTAANSADYNNIGGTSGASSTSGTISFSSGETSKTITLDVLGDTQNESNETAILTISNASASGNGNATLGTSSATKTINNDDNTPVVTASQSFSINENSANTSSVGTVIATDADAGTTFQNWTITGGNTGSAFAISPSTGELTVATSSALNYESTSSFNLSVTVSDGSHTSSAATVVVNLNDLNDIIPVVTASQSFSINENSANTSSVGTVIATDADAGTTFQNWTITGGNTGSAFAISPSTGELTVATSNALNYESSSSFNLLITVSDGSHTSSAATVVVNLNDLNDIIPVVTASQSFSINENSANTSTVGTVIATDADAGTTFQNWTITGGNTGSAFAIDELTGVISVNNIIDYELNPIYKLNITVSDGVNISMSEDIVINIIDDENDNVAPLSQKSAIFNESIHLYPNPANSYIVIDNMKSELYQLFNESGILVIQGEIIDEHEILDISKLQSGNYFLVFKSGSKVISKKIVKF